jgi:predicted adenylyl cyclase CyaB
MPRNVEIKARVGDVEKLEGLVYELTESLGTVLEQEDTFFNVPNGRLKLRIVDSNPHGELIQYTRWDQKGPKECQYSITKIEDAESLKQSLGNALGFMGIVKKKRQLYFFGQTRIHLDTVKGLGSFMELEVVLEEGQTVEEGEKEAHSLMEKLDIQQEDLVSTAYMDLILQHTNSSPPPPVPNERPKTS